MVILGGNLPSADSPDLALVQPTPHEYAESLRANGVAWKGPLSPEQYLQREAHLRKQDLAKDGALAGWILVDKTLQPDHRVILSSCETLKKTAFVARNGKVEDVVTHGVGSVYCRPEFRKRGYASRMIQELGKKLESWQQENGKKSLFSLLWSDIGKNFYAQHGWKPVSPLHMELSPLKAGGSASIDLPAVQDLKPADVKSIMCSEAVLQRCREILRVASEKQPGVKVGIAPDYAHMVWHWAREEFFAQTLFAERNPPTAKGAGVKDQKVFCTWTRTFGSNPEDCTLYILRTMHEEPTSAAEEAATVDALAAVLRRAQAEAAEWGLHCVEAWNPSALMQRAFKKLDPSSELIDRQKSSIPSLKWDGVELGRAEEVEWFWNEKYAWC